MKYDEISERLAKLSHQLGMICVFNTGVYLCIGIACSAGMIIEESAGTIQSHPSYPNDTYSSNMTCRWLLRMPEDDGVRYLCHNST